jgi:hypothetical protein
MNASTNHTCVFETLEGRKLMSATDFPSPGSEGTDVPAEITLSAMQKPMGVPIHLNAAVQTSISGAL